MAAQGFLPLLHFNVSDIFWTVGQVGHEASCDSCVFGHHFYLYLQLIALHSPSHLFVLQLREQLLAADLSYFCFFQLLLQYLGLVGLFHKILVEFSYFLFGFRYLSCAFLIPHLGTFEFFLDLC